MDLVIRNANVIDAHWCAKVDIGIEAGKIAALLSPGTSCAAKSEINAAGLDILPGLIDAHVHLREPGLSHKETIESGTTAAVCGGVTTLLDMPNTLPPVTSANVLQQKGALVAGRARADVGFYALLGPGMLGQFSALVQAGCIGFKLFLGPTTGNLQAPTWGELQLALREIAELGVPVVVHAEDRDMVEYWAQRTALPDYRDYEEFLTKRPAAGEVAATERICRLAGETGTPIHIAHVALAEAVEVIASAKAHGWQ